MSEKNGGNNNALISIAAIGIGAVLAGGTFLLQKYNTRTRTVRHQEREFFEPTSTRELFEPSSRELLETELSREIKELSKDINSSNKTDKTNKLNKTHKTYNPNETDNVQKSFDSIDLPASEKLKTQETTKSSKFKSDSEEFLPCQNKLHKDSSKIFREVDDLYEKDEDNHLNAFNILMENATSLSENPNFLWRLAKGYQFKAKFETDIESKKKFITSGLKYAFDAIKLEFFNYDAHKWCALLMLMECEYLPLSEKIDKAHTFLKHIKVALSGKEKDYLLHYSLGKFKYEVIQTTGMEKKLISVMQNNLTQFSINDAILDLKKAEELCPKPCKKIKLLLAKCYLLENNVKEAINWLIALLKIKSKTNIDIACDNETKNLLKKLQD